MNLKILMPAIVVLLLAAAEGMAQRVPSPPLMVLWYGSIALPRGAALPSGPFAQWEANSVTRMLGRYVDTILLVDSYFRRVIFTARNGFLDSIRALPWVVSTMPWPEVETDGADIGTGSPAGPAVPLKSGGARSAAAPPLRGAGVVVAMFDVSLPWYHPSAFVDLSCPNPGVDYTVKGCVHSTHVAGIVAGLGITNPTRYQGRAPGVKLRAWSIFDPTGLFVSTPPPTTTIRGYITPDSAIHVVQNSWTIRPPVSDPCDAFGTYNGFCTEYDKLVRDKEITVVFSVGNHRCTCYEALCGRGGLRTIMPPATSKNTINVGAVDANNNIAPFSSFGATADFRIDPSIVAPGVNIVSSIPKDSVNIQTQAHAIAWTSWVNYVPLSGTSMAAPAVSGWAALVIKSLKDPPSKPFPPALVKALLLNNAIDLGTAGPDLIYGYGLVNGPGAISAAVPSRFALGAAATGDSTLHTFKVFAGCSLKVMLCYSDIEALANTGAGNALINDLDLELVAPNGRVYFPLKLNPANPTAPAMSGVISNDNVEQVVVANPMAGTWKIRVKGTSVTQGSPQQYAVTWSRVCPTIPNTTSGSSSIAIPR